MRYCIARAHGGIGDILMMTPGIRALASEGHEVSVAIDRHRTRNDTYYQLLKDNKDIKFIYDYRYFNKKKFDKVVDITSVAYPYEQAGLKIGRATIFAKAMGVKIEDETPIFEVKRIIKVENSIALHFFATEDRRSLSLKKAKLIVNWLLENTRANLVILDRCQDLNINSQRVIYCGDKDIIEAAEILNGCNYFLGVDSGWMHVAGALNVPGTAIFGSTDPVTRIKDYKYMDAIYTKSKCRGCFYKPCDLNFDCMSSIGVLEIVDRLRVDALLL
jgi:hypothetical protein